MNPSDLQMVAKRVAWFKKPGDAPARHLTFSCSGDDLRDAQRHNDYAAVLFGERFRIGP